MAKPDAPETLVVFDGPVRRKLFEALVAAVYAHATELTDLDRAIGDGDHGINLTRGFKAVEQQIDELSALSPGPACKEVGKRLVMTVGGASGPLYGTLFLSLGDHLGDRAELSHAQIVAACDAAVSAVRARGKSDVGQKTLLDVLVPVQHQLRAGGDRLLDRLIECAGAAARATIPLIAQRGRAAFLGERSIGHLDPGARSCELLIAAACRSLQSPEPEQQ